MQRTLPSFIVILLAALFVYVPLQASAQVDSTLTIRSSSAYPLPGESVTLTLGSPTLDLSGSPITWRRDGVTILEGVGETVVTLTLGESGVETRITASAEGTSASITMTPSRVGLLWESDSYVPASYEGRALPSAGTRVRLWAIPHLSRANGTPIPAAELMYTWKLNDATLASLSGRGRSSAVIGSPELFGAYTVSVEVSASGGTPRGEARVRISSVEPMVRLYADHPLFGIQHWNALGGNAFVLEREMTFAAVPYFAQAQSADDPSLEYGWRINQKAVLPDPERPSAVTVSAQDESVIALLNLTLTHATNLLLEARGAWQITLGSGTDIGLFDAFRATP